MTDPGAGRHHAEVVEGFLPPAQKAVALGIALHLDVDVLLECRVGTKAIHHDRVIDDEVDRRQRIDDRRVLARGLHGLPHRCEICDARYAGEILHQHARWSIGDLARSRRPLPVTNGTHVVSGDRRTVLVAQQILEQDLHGNRHA